MQLKLGTARFAFGFWRDVSVKTSEGVNIIK